LVKVLHVAQSSEYGLGRYLVDLVEDQRGFGWEVVLAGDPSSSVRPAVEATGARWVEWRASRDPGSSAAAEAWRLRAIVRAVDPDLVHLHSSKAGLAGRLALRRRRPTIFQPHAWSWLAVGGKKRMAAVGWERLGARWADVIVCGSEGERSAGAAAGVRPRQWRVIPNAVDTDRFSPDPSGSEPALVVCAARLAIAQKGQDLLLAAWRRIVSAVPEARLALVGDGPDRGALEAQAAGLSSVEFVGAVDDVAPWFRRAAVVVQPSRYETLSLSVLEALACAKPVVATDAVGMREAIGDAGAVVPLEDEAALAAALVERLRDPALAAAEGARGRERVVARYSRSAWRDAMRTVAEETAATRPRR
jgi:glycosyltransferase involved in cell wall biosynthesis